MSPASKIYALVLTLGTFFAASAHAEKHLEVTAAFSSLTIGDDSYEAFDDTNSTMPRVGLDLRYELLNLSGFKFAPFLGYRYGGDTGQPYHFLDTKLHTHDLLAGVRVRKGVTKFMGVFIDLMGGATFTDMDASIEPEELNYDGGFESAHTYDDEKWTWTAGGLGGLEFYFPRSWMRARGVNRVNFGAELGAGYLRRGDIQLNPKLQSSDDNALPISNAGSWGTINQSGFLFQLALSASFY